MSIHMPDEFRKRYLMPGIKAAFVSKIEPTLPQHCKNCGGVGTIVLFIALEGPYDYVPSGHFQSPTRGKPGPDKIAKWNDGKWWAGTNYEEACPDCQGTGRDPQYKDQPAKQRMIVMPNMINATDSENSQ